MSAITMLLRFNLRPTIKVFFFSSNHCIDVRFTVLWMRKYWILLIVNNMYLNIHKWDEYSCYKLIKIQSSLSAYKYHNYSQNLYSKIVYNLSLDSFDIIFFHIKSTIKLYKKNTANNAITSKRIDIWFVYSYASVE